MRNTLLMMLMSIALFSTADIALAKGVGQAGAMPTKSKAVTNSNGIRSTDRDKGQARAAERRNAKSLAKHPVKKAKVKETKSVKSSTAK